MRLEKISTYQTKCFWVFDNYDLYETFSLVGPTNQGCYNQLIFENDENNKNLFLLAILSPIFIACFDNGKEELEFFKSIVENSPHSYGLDSYFAKIYYEDTFKPIIPFDKSIKEDISVNTLGEIEFKINAMDDIFTKSLMCLIDNLILDEKNRDELLAYFDGVDYQILINGRRSILANGIQAFYLRKYVVVWMLDLIKFVEKKNPGASSFLGPISNLINKLQTPANLR